MIRYQRTPNGIVYKSYFTQFLSKKKSADMSAKRVGLLTASSCRTVVELNETICNRKRESHATGKSISCQVRGLVQSILSI